MNTKPPECWANDPNAHAVRIELSSEHTLLLPSEHFVFAEMQKPDGEQHLRVVFTTHEIIVRGTALRRIETALQQKELSFLGCAPEHFEKLIPAGQPVVREILVTEVNERPGMTIRAEE